VPSNDLRATARTGNAVQQFWNTAFGKVTVILVAICLLVAGGIALYFENENRRSYQVGHDWGSSEAAFPTVGVGGVDADSFCEQGLAVSRIDFDGLARRPFMEGCRDGVAEVLD
jgi:hypothetical protein